MLHAKTEHTHLWSSSHPAKNRLSCPPPPPSPLFSTCPRLDSSEKKRQGTEWAMISVLNDLDYSDDSGLMAHRHRDTQGKTEGLCKITSTIIHTEVTIFRRNVFRLNVHRDSRFTLHVVMFH